MKLLTLVFSKHRIVFPMGRRTELDNNRPIRTTCVGSVIYPLAYYTRHSATTTSLRRHLNLHRNHTSPGYNGPTTTTTPTTIQRPLSPFHPRTLYMAYDSTHTTGPWYLRPHPGCDHYRQNVASDTTNAWTMGPPWGQPPPGPGGPQDHPECTWPWLQWFAYGFREPMPPIA